MRNAKPNADLETFGFFAKKKQSESVVLSLVSLVSFQAA
jgi:hypothetical protein